MALTDPVDIYCERLDPGFWAEPLNAASNIAFIAAALVGAAMLLRRGNRDADLWLLVALTATVGVGSFLFHTFATVWAGLADTIPIWVFVAVFVAVAMRRYFAMSPLRIAFTFAVLIAAGYGYALVSPDTEPGAAPVLNGSLQYAPAVIAQWSFVLALHRARHPAFGWVAASALVFLTSLVFRTLDIAVCDAFPAGTHFAWHILNGTMIAMLLAGIILHGRPAPR